MNDVELKQIETSDVIQSVKKEKKKMNVVLYTILMTIVFLVVTEILIYGYGGELIYLSVTNYPKGNLVIGELILSVLVLIVMLLFKNFYVFTQKNESLKVGLFYGLFYLIGATFFMLFFGVLQGGFFSGLGLLNVFLGALLVGICEEFLCRGWLLNEFLERYGDTKKGVWYSIIISGIIFGLIHLGNFFGGQDLVNTIIQVLSASMTGVAFGLIYYKTKNIWSVIILHGIWDFSLFLSELSPVTYSSESVTSMSIIGFVFTMLMVFAEFLIIIPHIKDIDSKPEKSMVISCSIVGFILYILFTMISGVFTTEYGDDYEYKEIKLSNYAVTRDNYEEYKLNHTIKRIEPKTDAFGVSIDTVVSEDITYTFGVEVDEKREMITIRNDKNDFFVQYQVENLYDYIVVDLDNKFLLAYVDYNDNSNPYLYYLLIDKDEFANKFSGIESKDLKFKKFLLPARMELVVVSDYEKNVSYLAAYDVDYGYFLLTNENEMSRLVK